MRKKLIAGNWKMNTNANSAKQLAQAFRANSLVDVLLIPPFPYLPLVKAALAERIKLGAQNLCEHNNGAFTGEVSADMLVDVGCEFVLVGHSERRTLYGESDAMVAAKFQRAQQYQLTPVLCVGESLAEREADQTLAVVQRQLLAVLDLAGIEAFKKAVVAYEPVWAIGTGKTATPEQAQAVHREIRSFFAERSASIGGHVQILYGGSVKASNARDLLSQADIDGALVGGAALVEAEFANIISAAS